LLQVFNRNKFIPATAGCKGRFWYFLPAEATHSTDGGEIWHGADQW